MPQNLAEGERQEYRTLIQSFDAKVKDLMACAVNSSSSSDCLDHFPPDFSFRRHIS